MQNGAVIHPSVRLPDDTQPPSASTAIMQAWETAPESFKREAARLGVRGPLIEGESRALEFQENYRSASYTPDMAASIDSHVDTLIEKYGSQHETIIKAIVADMQAPMEAESKKQVSLAVSRVAMYLVKTESGKLQARVHGLLHAIPRLAICNGFTSIRDSAKACKASPEWISRSREKWMELLDIPVPVGTTKSDEAIEKYRESGLKHHWRKQDITKLSSLNSTEPNPCKPIPTQRFSSNSPSSVGTV